MYLKLLIMPPKTKGKGKRCKGVTVSVSLAKQARKAVSCKQALVALTQALDQLLAEVDPAGGQDAVLLQLELMMTMLADFTRRVQASEDQARPATSTVSLSTPWADQRRTQVCHQPSPHRSWACVKK